MVDVQLNQISKTFGSVEIMRDLNLHVPAGSFTVLVGPSGCGKSTLLRMISGLEKPTGGTIRIGERDVTTTEPSERGISMVFQSYALFPHMTVAENIGFGMRLAKVPVAERKARVAEVARTLHLETYLDRKPGALSGGQRQRVAIGRSIVRQPQVFLFDEPLSNLDAALRNQMRVELAALHDRLSATMIYVTHDQVEAMTLADQIVVMNAGRIEQVGSPNELYDSPSTEFVASFIGSPKMNLIKGPIAEAAGVATYGIRPEHLAIDVDGEWEGRISFIEYLGNENIFHIDIPSASLILRRTERDEYRAGDRVRLKPDHRRCHLFNADGRRVERS